MQTLRFLHSQKRVLRPRQRSALRPSESKSSPGGHRRIGIESVREASSKRSLILTSPHKQLGQIAIDGARLRGMACLSRARQTWRGLHGCSCYCSADEWLPDVDWGGSEVPQFASLCATDLMLLFHHLPRHT